MVDTKRSPDLAPEYSYHRVVTADDSAAPTDKKLGMNMHAHEFANIQVIPSGATSNPAVEVLFWSDVAGKFIKQNTALTKTGLGAGTPYEFSFSCYSRIIFVMVTGILGGENVKVLVSGFGVKGQ
jgi:hypothetical protein